MLRALLRFFTIPILLTLARFVLILPIVWAIKNNSWGLALGLLVVAGITDLLDGYLARAWKQETVIGACLDPLADKFLIIAVYATLCFCWRKGQRLGVNGLLNYFWQTLLGTERFARYQQPQKHT